MNSSEEIKPSEELEVSEMLSASERHKVLERTQLPTPGIYASIRQQGAAELDRPSSALFFSGIVAGIAMSFSILTLALIRMHLPDENWEPLLSSFGYAAGFLIVILGRQQLFTESTLTAVLPVISKPTWHGFRSIARLWSIVFLANAMGCVLAAAGLILLEFVPPEVGTAILDASIHLTQLSAGQVFTRGIGAGFLVAAMVWMMPASAGAEFALISFTAWLIALGEFSHVIAGIVEISVLVMEGEMAAWDGLFTLTLPMLAGNIVGGTLLFAVLAYAQVHEEVK